MSRVIPHTTHAAVEVAGGAWVAVAPLVLGLGPATAFAGLAIGGIMIGLALQISGAERGLSLAAHASFDYALAGAAIVAGIAIGALSGEWRSTVFLAGVGFATAALTASTRWSSPLGA